MKKIFINTLVVVTLISVFNTKTMASPIGNSNMGREYLVNSDPLEHWSIGVFGGAGKRGVDLDKGGEATLDITRGMVYLGYDALSWLTPYAALGVTDSSLGGATSDSSTKFAYGAGVNLKLLNQEIMDPNLMIDILRINADVYYNGSETETFGKTVKWGEFTSSLTLGLINDTRENKEYFPESIGIYAGPIYSYYVSSDFDAQSTIGLLAGLDIFFTKRTSFDISVQLFDETTVNGSLNIRF
jgi:hypothetical protein